jgi:hypothetical protein
MQYCAKDGTFMSLNTTTELPSTDIPWYWHQVHLMLIFRMLVARLSTELAGAVMQRPSHDPRTTDQLPFLQATPAQLSQRLTLFQDQLKIAEDKLDLWEQEQEKEREQEAVAKEQGDSNDKDNKALSLKRNLIVSMAQLVKAYQLKPIEKRVIQFLVTSKTQPGPSVLDLVVPYPMGDFFYLPTSGADDNMAYRSQTVRYVCGVTTMAWSSLANEDHDLCKDRVLVLTQEEYATEKLLTVSEEVCRALFGLPLTSEDKLKLSGTKLLKSIQPDGFGKEMGMMDEMMLDTENNNDNNNDKITSHGDANNNNSVLFSSVDDTMADILGRLSMRNVNEDIITKGQSGIEEPTKSETTLPSTTESEAEQDVEGAKSEDNTSPDVNDATSDASSDDPTKPQAYTNELEYLQQFFEIVMHKVVYSRQRVQQERRNASLADNAPAWRRNPADTSSKQFSVGEISAKIRMGRRRMQVSLELTRKAGTFYPRLELLAQQLQLDDFQKFVLVYLAGTMVSPIFKACVHGEDTYGDNSTTKVGDLLVAYFESFSDQVSKRTYFYRSSTLLRKGLIKFRDVYRNPNDLTDTEVKLDRRVLDCIVGLDKESSEISHGSHLYEPKVSFDAVVLPGKLKETITKAVTHFEQFRTYRKHHPDFVEAIAYGVGLTLMFCGKSGKGSACARRRLPVMMQCMAHTCLP